jgi:hypothetical protein
MLRIINVRHNIIKRAVAVTHLRAGALGAALKHSTFWWVARGLMNSYRLDYIIVTNQDPLGVTKIKYNYDSHKHKLVKKQCKSQWNAFNVRLRYKYTVCKMDIISVHKNGECHMVIM